MRWWTLNKASKAIVFEYLESWQALVIYWYLLRGYEVYYLTSSSVHAGNRYIHKLKESGTVRYLPLVEPLHVNNDPAYDMAFEATDALYDHSFREGSPIVRRIIALYQSEDVHAAFKKQLLCELAEYFHCQLLKDQIQRLLPDAEKLFFVPMHSTCGAVESRYEVAFGNLGETRSTHIRRVECPWWLRLTGTAAVNWKKFRLGAVCLHTILMAGYQYLRSLGKAVPLERYQFGVAVLSPLREFANHVRGVDFLLDGQQLRKDNTIFVPLVRLTEQHSKAMTDKGLIVASHVGGTSGSIFRAVCVNGSVVLGRLLFSTEWVARVCVYLVRDYWIWSNFVKRYEVKNFVSYADFGFRQISRNTLLKRNGVQTWYYLDTENLGGLNFNQGKTPRRHQYWGYLYYDNCVAWSRRVIEYYQTHKQKVSRYFAVGCLWSEHIRLLRESKIPIHLREHVVRGGYSKGQKVIAVFDSTYNNLSRTTYHDGISFARGIEKLLVEFPDVFIVWKEKKPRWVHEVIHRLHHSGDNWADLLSLYEDLAAHPRCYFSGHETSSAEVLALCDLAISFPFTSTTLEALGARVKAIFYAPDRKFAGSYFERFPELVVHDYSELREVVDKLLYRTESAAYEQYLHTYLKGHIEPYLDGNALTRFRRLLSAESADVPVERSELSSACLDV